MTKSLTTIKKIFNKQLDIKKLQLKSLYEQQERLNSSITRLQQTLQDEQQTSIKYPEIRYSYHKFAALNLQRQETIMKNIKQLDKKIDTIRTEIFELFTTVKKYDLIINNKKERQSKELEQKEIQELEEMILSRFNNEA
ncbi:hypothetical protein NOVO_07220 [Rickettsiales bacterium Ac37b]|nr:hypothetical protein NOVO_07220 [Rickettsiales bacterium Ac37b]